jgi:hypothetical protein
MTAALAVAMVWAAPLAAADDAKKPLGTWVKKEGDATITFTIKPDGMTVGLKGGGDAKLEVEADYGLSKDGVLFARVSKITRNGIEGGPDEGELFSFRFKLDKDKLTISDLNAPKTSDDAKKLVEGDYEKSKEKGAF